MILHHAAEEIAGTRSVMTFSVVALNEIVARWPWKARPDRIAQAHEISGGRMLRMQIPHHNASTVDFKVTFRRVYISPARISRSSESLRRVDGETRAKDSLSSRAFHAAETHKSILLGEEN